MTPTDAARHLDIAPDADEATRQRAYRERREALERKIGTAPTPGLKEKYRASLAELEEAYAVLQQAAGQDAHLPGLAPDLRDEPAASNAGAPASPEAARTAKPAKPAVGSSSKLPLVASLLVIAALLGGGAFWYQQHSASRQAAATDLLGAIESLAVDAGDGPIAALRARVESFGDGPFDDHRATAQRAWQARQAAIDAHAEAQAQQAAATLTDRLASAKRQLNALSLRKDAFAETVRQAERQLSDWRSAEREANRANGWQAEYYSLARSGQERVVRWLSQQKVAHPAWLHLTNAEDFHRAENATATAEELAAAEQAIGQLETQASAEREALVHAPLWRWSMQQWFADNREPVRDYLASFPVPESERAALDASLAYLDEPGEELPANVDARLDLFEAVVGAHDERLLTRRRSCLRWVAASILPRLEAWRDPNDHEAYAPLIAEARKLIAAADTPPPAGFAIYDAVDRLAAALAAQDLAATRTALTAAFEAGGDEPLVRAFAAGLPLEFWESRHELKGHEQMVNGVAIALDGTWLASASEDGTVRIWDTATGRERHVLRGHERDVAGVAIAPDGTWLASASDDNTLRIWDAATGRARHVLHGHGIYVMDVAIAPDGRWLASASSDDTVQIWNAATGRMLRVLRGHESAVANVAIAPDGTWLASASWDNTLRIWDTATGRERHVLRGHESAVTGVAIAPDGTWLASASKDGTVRIWDAATGRARHVLRGHEDWVGDVAIAPDGTWLASASFDRTVRFWDTATGGERHVLGHFSNGVSIAPDGTWLAITSHDATMQIWGPPVPSTDP